MLVLMHIALELVLWFGGLYLFSPLGLSLQLLLWCCGGNARMLFLPGFDHTEDLVFLHFVRHVFQPGFGQPLFI